MTESSLSIIEWEALRYEAVIESIEERGSIHPSISKITVSRDSNYDISTRMEGSGASVGSHDPEPNLKKGESVASTRIVGYEGSSTKVTIDDVYQGDLTIRGDGRIEATALTFKILFEYPNSDSPGWLSIWCINGPRFLTAPRVTERMHEKKIGRKRERLISGESEHSVEFIFPGSGLASDHWLIKNSLFELRFCFVQPEFGPNWSRNCEIQLMMPRGNFSFDDSFDNILESLSFVVGKRLTRVGKSLYSASGYPIRESANNPWGLDIQQECKHPEMPPVPLSEGDYDFSIAEPIISKLTESFCCVRDEFSFSTAMWQFWMSKISPAEGSLVFLSMAVENIMTAWFKSTKTKTRAQYMSDEEFMSLAKEPMEAFRSALDKREYADRILRKVGAANNMGVNERYETFFKEIGLH